MAITAQGWGAIDKLAKAGDTASGTIIFGGTPGVQITEGPSNGYVLTSDQYGNATWQPATTVVTTTATCLYDLLIYASQPSAWWKLADTSGSGTAADSTGNGHTGTANTVTFGETGTPDWTPDTCALFTGVSPSHITTTFNPSGYTAFSVEAWINLNGNSQTGNPRIIANSHTDQSGDKKGFELALSGGNTPSFTIGSSTANPTITAGSAVASTGWVYLAATWNGTTATLYVNGASVGMAAFSGTMAAGNADISIGYDADYGGDYFHGYIFEVAVYPAALSADQIAIHYSGGLPSAGDALYLPLTGGTLSNTLVLNGSPGLQVTTGAAAGDVLTSDASGNATWQAVGSTGGGGTAGGDLSGTYPNPTVAKVHGVAVSGTPSAGSILVATSSTAMQWQAQTGIPPSGDTTGATDPVNIAAAVAANASISLGSGNYYFNQPVLINAAGVTVSGKGMGSTVVNITSAFSDPSSVTPGVFFAPAAFQVGQYAAGESNCTIRDLTINNTVAAGGSVACNGINSGVAAALQLDRIHLVNINGWAVEGYSGASASPEMNRQAYNYLLLDACAGGVHLNGATKTINSQASNWNTVSTSRGVTTGPAANLDQLFLESGDDFVGSNINLGCDAGTGAALHLNDFGAVWITGCDGGGASACGMFIEGTSEAVFTMGDFVGYTVDAIIQDSATVDISHWSFGNAVTNGMNVTTSGQVRLDSCQFGYKNGNENGRGAGSSSDYYDLNWTGSGAGHITNTNFGSQIQTLGTANGVQFTMNLSGTGLVLVDACDFSGTGTTINTAVTGSSTNYVIKNSTGFNPAGSTTLAVPASGTATSPLGYDAMFYITTGATGTSSVQVSGGPVIDIQANSQMAVFVPGQSTIKPSYSSTMTWVVDGL